MKSENERLVLNESLAEKNQVLSPAQAMRRCRSVNELPGHHRVTVLKRGDTERTRARLEAVAAGMVELKHLREKHHQMMEEALCDTSRKQLGQRSEMEERPKRRHQNSEKSNNNEYREYPSKSEEGKKSRQRVEHSGKAQSHEEIWRQNMAQHSNRYKDDLSRPIVIPRSGQQDDRSRRHQESQDCKGGPGTKPQEGPKRNPRQERSPGQRPSREPNDRRQQNWDHPADQRPRDSNLQSKPQGANHQGVCAHQSAMHRENVNPIGNRQDVSRTDQIMQKQVPPSFIVSQTGEVKEPAYYGDSAHHVTPHNPHDYLAINSKSPRQRTYYSSTKISNKATSGEGSYRSACPDKFDVISSVRATNQKSHKFEDKDGNFAKLWKGEAGFATPSLAHNDNELRHCLVLTQSDQRFSRGRTQSVHENFYYFPVRGDSDNQKGSNMETTEKYINNQPLKANARNANPRPQNNSQTSHNNANKAQSNSCVESSRMGSTQHSKSISWDELLVSVGLSKNISNNDVAKKDMSDSQMNIAHAGQTKYGPNENSAEFVDTKINVSQKPYRSQSFSGVQPSVYYSNIAQYSDMNKRQKIDNSAPQNNAAIINSISRHSSLSTVSSKIFNPLHEVDIRSMNKPGPVHAVTLQYAGLTTRHMSLGSIPSVSDVSPVATQGSSPTKQPVSEAGSLSPSNELQSLSYQPTLFDMHASQKHPSVDRGADSDEIIKDKSTTFLETHLTNVDKVRLNASVTEGEATATYSPTAFNRPRSSTSLSSPKYSSINTINEDSEEVFEYPVELNISPDKPISIFDTLEKSKRVTQDTVSTRGRSMTTAIPTRKNCHDRPDALNIIESQGLMLQKELTVIQNTPEITTPLSASLHPVSGLLPLKASDVTLVVDEGYITCDSASFKMHKITAGTTSADNSSVSSGSIGNVSANGDTLVCVKNSTQWSQRSKCAHTGYGSKIRNNKDLESSKRTSTDLSLETVDLSTHSASTTSLCSGETVELSTTHGHQNLVEKDNSGLNTDVSDKKESEGTGLGSNTMTRETSAEVQTLSPKKRQPFKQTAL